jgi:putative protease
MSMTPMPNPIPQILAPAGDKTAFLAALAAGADAIYCGLKIFSARMAAGNFSVEELARLTALAHDKGVKVFLAFNSMIKQGELDKVSRILAKIVRYAPVDGIIIQDPAMIQMARDAGFKKNIHLSTLGNCTHPAGLAAARQAGISKVVLPREFTIDEIKTMADAAPEGMDLEIFVHGALCYSVSGRCYWSSWFGGKSALRGRCVQPCRRVYEQKGQKQRFFSCMDFSWDVLAKIIKEVPQVTTWKIEGRKKSPHYVYYTVKAFRLFRDEPGRKKEALAFLDYAMGRKFSHYNLLSQRVQSPLVKGSETGSGLFLGRIKNPSAPYFDTREDLFDGDLLRIGYEEEAFHTIQKVTRAIPKKGKFFLPTAKGKKIRKGTPVFLIDRREAFLADQLAQLETQLLAKEKIKIMPEKNNARSDKPCTTPGRSRRKKTRGAVHMTVFRKRPHGGSTRKDTGLWISAGGYGIKPPGKTWLWLDPLLFPEDEHLCQNYLTAAIRKGAKHFVLNSPWQIELFKNPEQLTLWAGPFCNATNSRTLEMLKSQGFSGAIVSPELDRETFLSLPASAPFALGTVIQGNWPLAVSRIVSQDLALGQAFVSPKGEGAWTSKANTLYYTFPNWPLDLSGQQQELETAGYQMFVTLKEHIPKGVTLKNRPGLWNWNLNLI